MEYKWNEKELKEKLKNGKKANISESYLVVYEEMIDLLHGKYTSCHNFKKLDSFTKLRDRFYEYSYLYKPELRNYLSTIFDIELKEKQLIKTFKEKRLDISNDDMITLVYDILSTLDDKYVLQVYNEFIRDNNKYLNIMNYTRGFYSGAVRINGITYYDPNELKSYISIQRHNTAEDIKALTHEALHAVFNRLYKSSVNTTTYFDELEGRFANQLVSKYLTEHGMKQSGHELQVEELRDVLIMSYSLFLNDLLFKTSKNYGFRYKEATKELRERTNYKESSIKKVDLPFICTDNLFYTCNEILSYLICLDINDRYHDPAKQYHLIKDIRKHDNFAYVNVILPQEFDLDHIKKRTLVKEKEECDKKINYK